MNMKHHVLSQTSRKSWGEDIKTPDQELYDALFALSQSLEYETVDYLPDPKDVKDTEPFVFVGESTTAPMATKDTTLGSVSVTVHVFGTRKNRQTVSNMLNNLFTKISTITKTSNYQWSFHYQNTMPRMVPEKSSDGIFLWHGYMTVEMRIR